MSRILYTETAHPQTFLLPSEKVLLLSYLTATLLFKGIWMFSTFVCIYKATVHTYDSNNVCTVIKLKIFALRKCFFLLDKLQFCLQILKQHYITNYFDLVPVMVTSACGLTSVALSKVRFFKVYKIPYIKISIFTILNGS